MLYTWPEREREGVYVRGARVHLPFCVRKFCEQRAEPDKSTPAFEEKQIKRSFTCWFWGSCITKSNLQTYVHWSKVVMANSMHLFPGPGSDLNA